MIFRVVWLPELWQQIVCYLQQAELACLMGVCRTFNALVERNLYRRVTWSWKHSPPGNSAPIQQLLLNILYRPELALYIEEVCLTEFGYGPKPRLLDVRPFSDEEYSLVCTMIQDVGLPREKEWVQRLCDMEGETIIALIVLHLRNVRALTIDMFHRSDGYDDYDAVPFSPLGEVLRFAFTSDSKSVTRFECLTEFNWPSKRFNCHRDLIRRREVLGMLPILQAPRLRAASLKLNNPDSMLDVSSINSWLSARSLPLEALTKLTLRYTTVAESFLVQLLAGMPNLESFQLELYRPSDAQIFNGSLIRDALMPCRTVLRHLVITWEACDNLDGVEISVSRPLGCLKDFCALQYIEATTSALISNDLRLQDVLPCSLKTLQIKEGPVDFDEPWDERVGPMLEDFLPISHLRTPYLEKIMIGLHESLEEDDALHEELRLRHLENPNLELLFFGLYD